jgi:hypothetical protein
MDFFFLQDPNYSDLGLPLASHRHILWDRPGALDEIVLLLTTEKTEKLTAELKQVWQQTVS